MGTLEIEGLRFDDNGEYGIAQQQVASLFLITPTSAPKWLKGILRADASLFPVKTNREAVEGKRVRGNESAISILDFEKVIRALDKKGNKQAETLADSLVGLALTQLFSDAFGIKFEKDDRQQYLIKRQTHKEQFHPKFTAWLKKDAGGDSSAVNWGLKVDELKLAAGVPLTFIDEYNPAEYATIDKLNRAYSSYHSLRLAGISHEGAIGVLKLQNN
jgi:hypothetical protein